ncbi:tetratricopeptide repeat protein [Gracilimonas sp. BCB1]|uniref:tetratricopeptide repeat protein n=1 Tax=Gracilimonas sp. BCB1 TaxID=3152362 RepID=UPI0032D8C62A
MKKLLRNLLSAVLFVGILASCETTDPLIEEAQKNIFTQNYDSALAVLDRSIRNNPESGLPYYYKAMTFKEKAKTIPQPNERKGTYEDFRESAVTAREKFSAQEEVPSEAGDVDNLILSTWGFEHNKAIEYVNDDSLKATVEEPIKVAVAHLENAVIINPDSTLSWDILAQVQSLDGNYPGAIKALNTSMEMKGNPPSEDYLRLGTYYRESEQPQEAITVLENGVESYPDSVQLVQVLADVYMQAGQRDKSIATIEALIERDPDNAQYHLALGTQLLQATTEISERITSNYDEIYDLGTELRNNRNRADAINASIDSLVSVNEELTSEMNELSNRAESELIRVTELRPEDPKAYQYLGISFTNKAAALYEKRNFTQDNELASELDKQAKEELREAMKYYEKAVELEPDNTANWQSLSRIYVQLDMQEKAAEAMDKAGM